MMLLGQMWSLSIEEHFYLLWPLTLAYLLRKHSRKDAMIVMALAVVIMWCWRYVCIYYFAQGWTKIYVRFDTHATGLTIGCILALVGAHRLPKGSGWVGAALIATAAAFYPWNQYASLKYGIPMAEVGTALLLVGLQQPGALRTIFSLRPLPYLGKLSYGIYLWHYPIFVYLREQHGHWHAFLIGVPVSVALAALSYHTVEAYFRRQPQREVVSVFS
jgi:peptidoglycan/LPS O-acetylase OafA/YrhL